MKCSTSLLGFLVSLFLHATSLLHGQVAPAPASPVPICIDVEVLNGENFIKMNNQEMTPQRLEEWLVETKKQFGGDDPLLIRFGGDVSIGTLLRIREIALKTHHDVHLLFHKRKVDEEEKELLVSDTLPQRLIDITTPNTFVISQTKPTFSLPVPTASPTPRKAIKSSPTLYLIEVEQIRIKPDHAIVDIAARRNDNMAGTHRLEVARDSKFYKALLKTQPKLKHERIFFELVLGFHLQGTPMIDLGIVTEQNRKDLVALNDSLPKNPTLDDENVISVRSISLNDYLEVHKERSNPGK